nr:hypothetical protein [Tanacetum cinerariifolium]
GGPLRPPGGAKRAGAVRERAENGRGAGAVPAAQNTRGTRLGVRPAHRPAQRPEAGLRAHPAQHSADLRPQR